MTNSNNLKILVADDDPAVLDIFRQVLLISKSKPFVPSESEAFGHDNATGCPPLSFDLVTCQQGNEAVNAMKRSVEENRPFSVAFIDIRMPPGPDGIWTAEQIRRLDDNVEILIMTGYSDVHPMDISCRVPPAHKLLYVQKPFHIQEIYQFAYALSMKWHTECEFQKLNKFLEQCVEDRIQEIIFINKELQKKFVELQETQAALQKSEGKLNAMMHSMQDHISMMDKDLTIIWANSTAMEIFGENIIGKKCYEVYHRRKEPCEPYPCLTLRAFEDGRVHEHETRVIDKNGNTRFFYCTANVALRNEDGNPTAVLEVSRDITEQKKMELTLLEAQKDLDQRVKKRTAELDIALKTIKRSEKELTQRKSALEKLNKELLETNQAVSVLARNIDRKKEELERKIYEICSGKLMPILKRLQKDVYCKKREADLELILNYLNEIVHDSPLIHDIGSHLTEQEMRVAMLIKNGLTSQQIADSLSLSVLTVKTHRRNIRRKLNIENERINLASYLKSRLKSDPIQKGDPP